MQAVLEGLRRVIISAPFGNWLSFPGCTSTLGTFTLANRGGLMYRLWRCLLTLRYNWRQQSWINKLGLPNPGADSLPYLGNDDKIVSIHGFGATYGGIRGFDWIQLVNKVSKPLRSFAAIEFNLSCPNVGHRHAVEDMRTSVQNALMDGKPVIAKLPPVRWMGLAIPLWEMGVRHFHACNTIPSPGGGISGKPLKQYSLWAVENIKQRWGEAVTVIGGGGITGPRDVADYRRAGADHVAIGSMLLNPLNWKRVSSIVEAMHD